jgi:hypothetical protein
MQAKQTGRWETEDYRSKDPGMGDYSTGIQVEGIGDYRSNGSGIEYYRSKDRVWEIQ